VTDRVRRLRTFLSANRRQHRVLALIGVATLGLSAAARLFDDPPFESFVADAEPTPTVAGILVVGAASVSVLAARLGFVVWRGSWRGPALAAGLASVFGVVIVAADLVTPYAEDTNVAFPGSLVFYPVIAVMVESLFHLLPLALVLGIGFPLFRISVTERRIWAVLTAIATIEPSFQAAITLSGGTIVGTGETQPLGMTAFTWVHMFLFNLTQLTLFRRRDFVSMLSMRLSYYLWWHVIWGHLRLRLLF